jgi:hypothetical protein
MNDPAQPRSAEEGAVAVDDAVDLVEWYYGQPWSDGLPVVPPTVEKIAAVVAALGGDPGFSECRVPPRGGDLTRHVLAVNLVMAGCKPAYAPIVRAALVAMCEPQFNMNALQASTHMAAPLLVVNGPIRNRIGMNAGCNVFGSGNRANATIGRAIRLVLLAVGGGTPGDLDKSTLGHPGKYTYCIAENEEESPWAPYHVENGHAPDEDTVFVLAAETPHSVTNHVSNDPRGILDSIASAMSTIAHNTAVMAGPCAVVLGPEHAATIARHHWTRHDVRCYLCEHSGNRFDAVSFGHRYGKVYNRALPRWYRRDPNSRIPIAERPEDIHLFVAGGSAGRFSAFIPGWGNVSQPMLRSIGAPRSVPAGAGCEDGTCRL